MVGHHGAGPTTRLKSAVGILTGVPRSLYDSIQRHVLDDDESHLECPQLLKNSIRAGAIAAGSTLCCCPTSVRRCPFASAVATASALAVSQGDWPPSSTSVGTLTLATLARGNE